MRSSGLFVPPMLLGKSIVGERLLDRRFHELRRFGQAQAAQLLDHLDSFLPCRHEVLAGMDRLEHRGELAHRIIEPRQPSEDEIAAEMAVAKTTTVAAFTRKRPARKPFPEHLPRERVIVPGPTTCLCCGGGRLRKLGETVTETLESIPRQWKLIQHVREKFTCRDCEKISQAPAPFHVIARGWAGPSLLAMILFEKFGQHQPLNRQAERYAKEGVPLSLSTLADQVGAGCAVLEPILRGIEALSSRPPCRF